jgi:hypothetical protein
MTDLEKIHKIWDAYDEVIKHASLTESKDINYQISEMTDIDEKTIKGFFKVVDTAEQSINDRLFIGEITINEALALIKNNNKQIKTVEKLSLWDLGEDARKLKDSIIHIENNKRKYKEAIHNWIINHLFDGVSCEDIAHQLSSVFDKDYNIMLTAVHARKEDINKRVAAANLIKLNLDLEEDNNNKQLKPMSQVRFYTVEEINIIKTDIATGEPIKQISKRLSKEFDRPILGLEQKMYLLKKEVPVIAKWNGPRLRRRTRGKAKKSKKATTNVQKINFEPIIEQQPAEIGIEVPHGMTFEGKPKKIMLHSDHFRIYF